jgi:hypothetical protein
MSYIKLSELVNLLGYREMRNQSPPLSPPYTMLSTTSLKKQIPSNQWGRLVLSVSWPRSR